jgi:hypothetical protein
MEMLHEEWDGHIFPEKKKHHPRRFPRYWE